MMSQGNDDHEMVLRVRSWLAERSDKELVELFNEVLETRRQGLPSQAEERLIVAQVAPSGPGAWDLLAVAPDDADEYPQGWASDAPLCQYATCPECGWDLVSWAKHALCPVCGEKCYCT
jgi:hypothetical protein